MQPEAKHSRNRPAKIGIMSIERGRRIDDLSLRHARHGLVLGAVLGVILGITLWHSWLVSAIVLGIYGTMLGGVVGVAIGMVRRDVGF